MTDTAWITLGGIVTLLVKSYFDQRAVTLRSRELRDELELSKAEAVRLAAELAVVTARQNDAIVGKLEENTDLTHQAKRAADAAFEEANTVNRKLETIGVQMRDGQPLNTPPGGS